MPHVQALLHLARAANLASRSSLWRELLICLQHTSSVITSLLNAAPDLTNPLPRCTWQMGPLPPYTPDPDPVRLVTDRCKRCCD
jgi:hypothetical protein